MERQRPKFPAPRGKYPAGASREFAHKLLNPQRDFPPEFVQRAIFRRIPCRFPSSRECRATEQGDENIRTAPVFRRLLLPPFENGFAREVFIRTRRVTQQCRQGREIAFFRREAAFEIALEHHTDVECGPRGRTFARLFLERVHIVAGITDAASQLRTPDRRDLRSTQDVRAVEIVGLALVPVLRQCDGGGFGDIPGVDGRNAFRARENRLRGHELYCPNARAVD